MRVIVADDQEAVRSALGLVLDEDPALQVVAEAEDAGDLLQIVRNGNVDLVLMDWELPGLGDPGSRSAEAFLDSLRSQHPQVRVIVMSSRPESRLSALAAGADAFIYKGDPPEFLLLALKQLCIPD